MALERRNGQKQRLSRNKLDARHLRLVLAIARRHSVTGAAQDLNLSQSALSHQLLNIERGLEVALFHRVGKTMVPTPAGHRLMEYAERILSDLASAENAIRAEHEEGRVALRLTTGCFTHYPWLATAVSRFTGTHPRVDVRIVFDDTRKEFPALQANKVDMIVTTRPPTDRAFACHKLFSDETVAVLAVGNPLAGLRKGSFLRWNELSESTILIYDVPEEDEAMLRKAIQSKDASSRSGPLSFWRVQLTEAIVELAAADQGVGVVGTRYIRPYLTDRRLSVMPLGPGGRRTYWAVWHRSNPRNLPVLELANEVRGAWMRQPSRTAHKKPIAQ